MHVIMTAFCTTRSTRIWMHALYITHHGLRSDEMTLAMLTVNVPRKKIPAKVMWYAPIIPHSKHIFRNIDHAKLLRWHKEDCMVDNILRHPADGSQWRAIDREFSEFASDARNLRFALSTDGLYPFREQSSSHSTWPITLCIYNVPPW